MKNSIFNKEDEAKEIIKCSIGSYGIYAGCGRYKDQYWTRDFAIAGIDLLMSLGYQDVVKKHLLAIAERQRSSGSIPARFTKNRISFIKKIFKDEIARDWSYLLRKLILSQKYLIKRNPSNFHRWFIWYADIEILFIIASMEYIKKTNDEDFERILKPKIEKAFNYIEYNLMQNGLVIGADWRDVIYSLSDKSVFSVNILLWKAYELYGKKEKADKLKRLIEINFWNGNYYCDVPGDTTFDLYGHSIAVLWDFIPNNKYESVLKKINEMKTPFGYKANDMLFPKELSKYQKYERTNQFSTIWPFIYGYGILALIHMKQYDLAKEQIGIWEKLSDFFEWYNPKDGKGYGEQRQMWSAALYLRVYKSILSL